MSDQLVFETAEWEKGVQAAFQKLIDTEGPTRLKSMAERIRVAARKYVPVDTGRLKEAIIVGPLKKEGAVTYVTVGVTLESLKNASAGAQKQLDKNVRDLLSGKRKGLGVTNKSPLVRRIAAPTINYGVYVEFGTSKTHAQPFMRPALSEVVGIKAF